MTRPAQVETTGGPAVSGAAEVAAARRAVSLAFASSGLAFATWASRIPDVRDTLRLTPGALGLVLLSIAVGSLVAMPLSGLVVSRFGSARAVSVMALVLACGLAGAGLGYRFGAWPLVVALFAFGFGNGVWDVAMNVQGAAVEQRLGRAIMPRFHAGWSVGTVAGALIGSGLVALRVPVRIHLVAVAVLVGIGVPLAVRSFLPTRPAERDRPTRSPLRAWTEPRTLLLGCFVCCLAFSEGTGNDWLAIAAIDGYSAPHALGPLTFAIFLAAMTGGRWFGPGMIDRFGRIVALRFSSAVAVVGLLLVVFGQVLPVAVVGAVLWGVGTALGFPVGMSAGADDPAYSAARVSVVASIGYTAFLGGPPLIGFVANHVGVLRALAVAAVVVVFSVPLAAVTRPLRAPGHRD